MKTERLIPSDLLPETLKVTLMILLSLPSGMSIEDFGRHAYKDRTHTYIQAYTTPLPNVGMNFRLCGHQSKYQNKFNEHVYLWSVYIKQEIS